MENNTPEIKPKRYCPECEFRKIMLHDDPIEIRCIRRDILDYIQGILSLRKEENG